MGKQDKPVKKKKHKNHKRKKKSSKLDNKHKQSKPTDLTEETLESNYAIPLDLMCKSHAPETPEEYQLRQKKIRYETDPITGRKRLIKGDGEILEEIVSRKQHLEINKQATQGDGRFFQNHLGNIQ